MDQTAFAFSFILFYFFCSDAGLVRGVQCSVFISCLFRVLPLSLYTWRLAPNLMLLRWSTCFLAPSLSCCFHSSLLLRFSFFCITSLLCSSRSHLDERMFCSSAVFMHFCCYYCIVRCEVIFWKRNWVKLLLWMCSIVFLFRLCCGLCTVASLRRALCFCSFLLKQSLELRVDMGKKQLKHIEHCTDIT